MSKEVVIKELFEEHICGCKIYVLKTASKISNNPTKYYVSDLCYYHDEYLGRSIRDMENDPSNYEGIDGCEWADKLAEE